MLTQVTVHLFKESESIQGDISAGIIAVAIALGLIAISLFGMSRLIRSMLVETPIEVIARISDINNYTSMLLSTIITMLLGSASLTESFFNPFLAYGIYELEQVSRFYRNNSLHFVLVASLTVSFNFLDFTMEFGCKYWYSHYDSNTVSFFRQARLLACCSCESLFQW